MKLKILGCGTSTGVPIPGCKCSVCTSTNPKNKRTRTSAVLVLDNGCNILIDASIDLRQQALTHKIERVDAVLYTHHHSDHILGSDDLRVFNFVLKKTIPCFAGKQTVDVIKQTFPYIFDPDPNYEGGMLPQLSLSQIEPYRNFEVCNTKIEPVLLQHGSVEVMGYKFGEIAYATDCKSIPDRSMEVFRDVKYLVLDGLRYEQHKTHMTIDEAVQTAQKLNAQYTYLIHMTHTVDYEEVNKKLPPGVELAYDGLLIGD